MTLLAQCSNCVSWQTTPPIGGHATGVQGFCMKGLYADPGAHLCGKYEATPRFQQQIISAMMKEEGPMALPVKLVGGKKSARDLNKKLQRKHGGKK